MLSRQRSTISKRLEELLSPDQRPGEHVTAVFRNCLPGHPIIGAVGMDHADIALKVGALRVGPTGL